MRALSSLFLAVVFAAVGCSSSTPSSTVSAISLSPSPCVLGHGASLQLSAIATLPTGEKRDVTKTSTWSTKNPQTATISAGGVVVGVNAGVTTITAAYEGASEDLSCTVGL